MTAPPSRLDDKDFPAMVDDAMDAAAHNPPHAPRMRGLLLDAISALQRERDELVANGWRLVGVLDLTYTKLAASQAALEHYGVHDGGCHIDKGWGDDPGKPCTCGLEAALSTEDTHE